MIEALLDGRRRSERRARRRRNAVDDGGAAPATRQPCACCAVRGADVNATGSAGAGETALMWAAAENHEAVARLLIGARRGRERRAPRTTSSRRSPAATAASFTDRAEGGLTASHVRRAGRAPSKPPSACSPARRERQRQRASVRLHAAPDRDLQWTLRAGARVSRTRAPTSTTARSTRRIETRNLATHEQSAESSRHRQRRHQSGSHQGACLRTAPTRTCRTRRRFRRARLRATSTCRRAPRRSIAPREPPTSRRSRAAQ